jgi:hypothetical protein
MLKKYYGLAIVSFLLIPVVFVLGGMLFSFINPEIAAGHPNYVRNYRILHMTKMFALWGMLLENLGLWFLTCVFLIKSKKQSYEWLCLAIFGPLGFAILSMLRDKAPAIGDLYQQYISKLNIYLRVAQEICFFMIVWTVAYQIVVVKRDLMIMYHAATTGVSVAQIIEQQNASGGMWAFSEGNECMYLMVLLYLLWPVGFNLLGNLLKSWGSAKKA